MRLGDRKTRPAVERLMCLGYSNREIARRLGKHVVTIEKAVTASYEELGISNETWVSRRVTFVMTYLGARGILDYEALKKLEGEVG